MRHASVTLRVVRVITTICPPGGPYNRHNRNPGSDACASSYHLPSLPQRTKTYQIVPRITRIGAQSVHMRGAHVPLGD